MIPRPSSLASAATLSLTLVSLAAAAPSDLVFNGATTPYPSGRGSWGIAAADLDGDGDVDLATGTVQPIGSFYDQVGIWANDGAGGFTRTSLVPIPSRTYDVALGDLDGDGDADLVVGLFTPGNRVQFFDNDGAGAFTPAGEVFVNASVTGLTLADLDGDGSLDVAVTLRSVADRHVGVLLNDGSGGFSGPPVRYEVGPSPDAVVAVDLDRDGWPELVAVNRGARSISVLPALGGGVFGAEVRHAVGEEPTDVAAGDLDGDGAPDLVVVHDLEFFVSVLRGDGQGGIAGRSDVPFTLRGSRLVLGDADADGDLDVAVGRRFYSAVALLENQGDGTFERAADASTGYEPASIVAADLDGDGALDLATANDGIADPSLTILRNGSAQAPGERFCGGASAACPCGNGVAGRGCGNAVGRGALLTAEGSTSAAADDLVLWTHGMPLAGFATTILGRRGAGTVALQNGALCLTGTVYRFPPYATGAGSAALTGVVAASQSNPLAGRITAGSTWAFQTWYRDAGGPCGGAANLSNGLEVTFAP